MYEITDLLLAGIGGFTVVLILFVAFLLAGTAPKKHSSKSSKRKKGRK